MNDAYFSFGYSKQTRRIEFWTVFENGTFKVVSIEYDCNWFKREGSINDLKLMAKREAA